MPALPGSKITPLKCPLCEYTSARITSVSKHVSSEHGRNERDVYLEVNPGSNQCRCGCGKETTWINLKVGFSTMIKGHNASIYNVYSKEDAERIASTRGSNWKGKESWSKGLTKETDERVAERAIRTSIGRKEAFEKGTIAAWSKGLTKETDERVAAHANNLKGLYESGEISPWAKGLTKESDERVARMASAVSLTHKSTAVRARLDELKRFNEGEIRELIEKDSNLTLVAADGYINDNVKNITVRCKTCGSESIGNLRQLRRHRCFTCSPAGSAAQAEIAAFLLSLGLDVKQNIRSVIPGLHRGAELDMFVEDRKLAVEYNGLYWHCGIHKTDAYHQNKSEECAKLNIALFHVFEDEWRDKRSIVESMLRHRIGLSERIGARSCSIVEVDTKERRAFFDENHIDGDTQSTIAFGLKDKSGRLVMVMSLRKPFHKKHIDALEVARLASLRGVSVVGGMARLTKECSSFTRNFGSKKMLTYVDTRHGSKGDSWMKAGWSFVSETTPRFWWTDFNNRFNRFKIRADKSRGMSEAQVAEEAGVVRIYGCKNITLELTVLNGRRVS